MSTRKKSLRPNDGDTAGVANDEDADLAQTGTASESNTANALSPAATDYHNTPRRKGSCGSVIPGKAGAWLDTPQLQQAQVSSHHSANKAAGEADMVL